MITFLTGLGSKLWGYLAAAGIFLAAVATFWLKAKSEGRQQERAKQTEETLDAIKDKVDLDRELDDADARRKLREKHYRD